MVTVMLDDVIVHVHQDSKKGEKIKIYKIYILKKK